MPRFAHPRGLGMVLTFPELTATPRIIGALKSTARHKVGVFAKFNKLHDFMNSVILDTCLHEQAEAVSGLISCKSP